MQSAIPLAYISTCIDSRVRKLEPWSNYGTVENLGAKIESVAAEHALNIEAG